MGDKRAVCVGINYPGTDSQLSGCVNDANDWASLLGGAGYSPTVILDDAATKSAILAALRSEVDRLGWGDRLVFSYSGHGTWVPDRDGDEADRRDEALCPADFMSGNLITDDELQSVFAEVPTGAGALILSDSCHSGTVSRFASVGGLVLDPEPDQGGNREGPGKVRFVSPAVILPTMTDERAAALEERVSATPPRATASLISGCSDLEYSYDAWFGNRANGAMSRHAIDAYTPGVSLNNWYKAIRAALPSDWYPQTPQLQPSSLYRKYTRAV